MEGFKQINMVLGGARGMKEGKGGKRKGYIPQHTGSNKKGKKQVDKERNTQTTRWPGTSRKESKKGERNRAKEKENEQGRACGRRR